MSVSLCSQVLQNTGGVIFHFSITPVDPIIQVIFTRFFYWCCKVQDTVPLLSLPFMDSIKFTVKLWWTLWRRSGGGGGALGSLCTWGWVVHIQNVENVLGLVRSPLLILTSWPTVGVGGWWGWGGRAATLYDRRPYWDYQWCVALSAPRVVTHLQHRNFPRDISVKTTISSGVEEVIEWVNANTRAGGSPPPPKKRKKNRSHRQTEEKEMNISNWTWIRLKTLLVNINDSSVSGFTGFQLRGPTFIDPQLRNINV